MHLYDETLERYLAHDLPARAMSAIDAHVSNCLPCAHALGEWQAEASRWERRGLLGRLTRVEEPRSLGAEFADEPARAA